MKQVAMFRLKCVGCHAVEDRPAEECREQPFCKKCYMPMVLERVSIKVARKKKGTKPHAG